MRPGRVVVLASLPLLAGLGVLRGAPALPLALAAAPEAVPAVVVTDGRPQLVVLEVRRSAPAPARPVASAPAGRPVAVRSSRPVAARGVVRQAAPAPRTATSDGYPWAHDTSGGSDPWGFTKRQCVSYVAWWLGGAGRPVLARDGWGSALNWDQVAASRGVPVSSSPSVGAVAQWDAGESSPFWSGNQRGTWTAGSYGHVAVVTRVYSDGSVQVAQYNGAGDRSFSTMRVRAPRYLSL